VAEHIRQTSVLSERELGSLFRFSPDPFDTMHLDIQWRAKDLHFLLDRDGRTVSHVGIVRHAVRVAGSPVTVAGFGGVVTLPEARNQGCATTLMRHAMTFVASDWKVDAGLLFCLPRVIAYYGTLGWRSLDEAVTIDQPAGPTVSPLPVMVLPVALAEWPRGPVDLDSQPW
jgi:aminoglycoside 2'-N-acetyltransferase I